MVAGLYMKEEPLRVVGGTSIANKTLEGTITGVRTGHSRTEFRRWQTTRTATTGMNPWQQKAGKEG